MKKSNISSSFSSGNAGHYSAADFLKNNNIFDKPTPAYKKPAAGTPSSTWNPQAEKSVKQSRYASSGKAALDNNPFIQKGFGNMYSSSKKQQSDSISVNYSVGDRVKHKMFGEGIVKEMFSRSGDYQVTVSFDNGTQRKMMASFAKLKKI